MEDNIFAATPPLEALRMVISNATTGKRGKVIMIADVSRAYMYARIPEDEYCYVNLCDEDKTDDSDEYMCGRLKGAMYGTRKASQYWQTEYTQTMTDSGFETGRASPCTFQHKEKEIMCFVHGDDFVASGKLKDIQWMRKELEAKYEIKVTIIGEAPELAKEGGPPKTPPSESSSSLSALLFFFLFGPSSDSAFLAFAAACLRLSFCAIR